jgi:hypothetical protein
MQVLHRLRLRLWVRPAHRLRLVGAGGRRCDGAAGRAMPPSTSRRIGLGRAGRFKRCALPTTAFFETPIRRPISAVE